MKYLMILNDLAWFWSHRLPLARAIQKQGWDLSLATATASSDSRLKAMGVRGLDLPDHDSAFSHALIIARIFKLIRREKPDIVHAITIRHAFYTGLVTRVLHYGPVVFTIAGLGSLFTSRTAKARLLRPLVKLLFRFAFARPGIHIIFQNMDDRTMMLDAGIITADQTTVIRGSGVDLQEFSFSEEVETDRPIVLFVSRLLKEKGIGEFVEAARRLKRQGSAARFVVAGDFYSKNPHSLEPAVMEQWVREGIVEWLGHVQDMPSLLKKSALVVLPSYYGEGLPKALLEASATGRAIVTTDMPGCREAVIHDYNGYLVPPRDAQAVADAIARLMNDPQTRRAMGRHGRELAGRDFAVESVVSRTLAVYDRLLDREEDRDDYQPAAHSARA